MIENYDQEIESVEQTLLGNTEGFDWLVRKYRSTIYALIFSYVKNTADAEDITQMVFIKAFESLETLKNPKCFSAWLQQIAHNQCRNWLKRCEEAPVDVDDASLTAFASRLPSAEKVALTAELQGIVQRAIDDLRETDRRLLESRYLEGASYDQLQAESGLSYAAIVNRIKRAKQHVRKYAQRLLGGVALLPGEGVFTKLTFGGIEAMKWSMKAKLALVGVAVVVSIGSVGAIHWYAQTSDTALTIVQTEPQSEATQSNTSANGKTPIASASHTKTRQVSHVEGAFSAERASSKIYTADQLDSLVRSATASGRKVSDTENKGMGADTQDVHLMVGHHTIEALEVQMVEEKGQYFILTELAGAEGESSKSVLYAIDAESNDFSFEALNVIESGEGGLKQVLLRGSAEEPVIMNFTAVDKASLHMERDILGKTTEMLSIGSDAVAHEEDAVAEIPDNQWETSEPGLYGDEAISDNFISDELLTDQHDTSADTLPDEYNALADEEFYQLMEEWWDGLPENSPPLTEEKTTPNIVTRGQGEETATPNTVASGDRNDIPVAPRNRTMDSVTVDEPKEWQD